MSKVGAGFEILVWARRQKVGHAGAKAVLKALADHAGADWECWPSYATIAEECEVQVRTVQRHIERLVEAGFVARTRQRSANGEWRGYRYRLNPDAEGAHGRDDQDFADENADETTAENGASDHRTNCPVGGEGAAGETQDVAADHRTILPPDKLTGGQKEHSPPDKLSGQELPTRTTNPPLTPPGGRRARRRRGRAADAAGASDPPTPIALPTQADARRFAEALLGMVGEARFRSWFMHDGACIIRSWQSHVVDRGITVAAPTKFCFDYLKQNLDDKIQMAAKITGLPAEIRFKPCSKAA